MSKKKIMRIVAAVMACASIGAVGAFGLTACSKKDDTENKPPVESVAVDGVNLSKTELSLKVGASAVLMAEVTPDGASNKHVKWESSNPEIATVSSGLVTAVKAGTATITVTTDDGGKTATCAVTVEEITQNPPEPGKVAVTAVVLSKKTVNLKMGDKVTDSIEATVAPENATNKKVTWASSDPEIVTVDQQGNVTAVKDGTVTITVTTEDGNHTASCTVTVAKADAPEPEKVAVTGVSLKITEKTLKEGEHILLEETVAPETATNKNVTWASDNTAVATVKDGLVTAVKAGTANITVTTEDGSKTATCVITVEKGVTAVQSVALDKRTAALTEGGTETVKATVAPADATNKTLIWTSSDTSVAVVVDGTITAIKEGTATITVTTEDGHHTDTCTVTVSKADAPEPEKVAVTGVSLENTKVTLKIGKNESVKLTPTIAPADATNKNVTWASDNTAVATVENGIVTAVSAGKANITVTTEDGAKTATCEVTVEEADPVITGVTVKVEGGGEPTVVAGGELALTADVAGEGNFSAAVTWKIDESATTATGSEITQGGVLTAGSVAGTVMVVVTSVENPAVSGKLVVTVTPATQQPDDPQPGNYTPNGVYPLDIAGGEDKGLFTSKIVGSDSGYRSGYFKLSSSKADGTDYLYISMKLPKNKIINISGTGQTSNKTDSSKHVTISTELKSGSTGAITGLPASFKIAQADGSKNFAHTFTVSTDGDIVLQLSRTDGNTGCDITELSVEIKDSEPVNVQSVSLNKTATELKVGGTEKLTATVTPENADNTEVVWASDNTAVATVDQQGNVTAVSKGTANITVTSKADATKKATCAVTVNNVMPTAISLGNTEATTAVDKFITLTATVTPADTTVKTVTWSSADPTIATVDANGKVTGVKVGDVVITATSTEDKTVKATITVHVLAEIVDVTGISIKEGTTGTANTEAEEKTFKLTAEITPANATNKSITWTSSDETVASVDQQGNVTAHKKSGTAVITATTADGGFTATYTLTVEGPAVTANTPVIKDWSKDEFETAYVTWTVQETQNIWFDVYCKEETASTWTKLDAPLVRQYAEYYRADMVGLKAGTYQMKVVPVVNGTADTSVEAISNTITVKAHDRSGYAFYNGACPGAYKADGTLKDGAIVLYVTNENVDTISLTTGKGERVGIHSILGEGYLEKSGDTKPLSIRLIGDVKHTTDLDIKGLTNQGVTVEGIGNDATMNGWGVHMTRSSNVEIRNIGFMNTVGGTLDNIGSESGCTYLWVHNCDMFYGGKGGDSDQAKGDGALDSKGTDYATYSYNHFWDSGKSNLLGNSSTEEGNFEGGRTHLSYHHNWYDHSDSRHPRIRSATVHVYNNYYDGNAKYGVGVTRGASAFVEANYFRSTAKMRPMMSSLQGTDIALNDQGKQDPTFSGEDGGIIKAFNNKIVGTDVRLITYQQDPVQFDCYMATTRDEQVPSSVTTVKGGHTYNNFDTSSNFKNLYKATVEDPDAAKTTTERYAGRLDGGDFKWEFDDATEDANYNLIQPLKNALVAYKTSIVKIGK